MGDAYTITDEGRAAPPAMTNIRDGIPEGLSVTSMPICTPTFVLARDGQEIGRIEGHPGEVFFCGLLARCWPRRAPTLGAKPGPPGMRHLPCRTDRRPRPADAQRICVARRRLEGLVSARREGQAIFYSILDPKVERMVSVLAEMFCPEDMRHGDRTKG